MNLKKLLSVLVKQEYNLNSLLKKGHEKKDTLVANNYDKLSDIVATEEQILLSIQQLEEKRLNIMQDLFVEYKIDNERYKLEILVKNLNGKVEPQYLAQINAFEKRMKKIISDITEMNHLNLALIQQSRILMNETLQAVMATGSKALIDRKG